MAASLLKTSSLSLKTKLLHQIGFPLYNSSHGFHEENVKKKLQQFAGGSIDLQKEDCGIGILTLNNPDKRNAFSGVMMLQLLERVIELENWKEGKGLIVCGAKNTFCSGSDLNAVKALGTSQDGVELCMFMQNTLTRFMRAVTSSSHFWTFPEKNISLCAFFQFAISELKCLWKLPLISVALVQGRAMGGGAEFTTACDFRLMTPSSEIRFVHKEMGITPSWGGAARLTEIIGSRQALKVLSGALKLDPTIALEIGIADEILQSSDEGQSLEEARKWLQQFISGPSEVIRALKTVVSSGKELALEEALETERDVLSTLWGGPANLEAIAKRKKFYK
uniref:Ethylmalonyl-CoA decarboxylase n=1 Tax=Monodelphis domestica TaxID=13616 RepID=A0A5F8G3J6_MONDO